LANLNAVIFEREKIEINAYQTNRKHMEWLKLFGSDEEARARIKENIPQLIIAKNKRICLALHEGVFYAVQDSCTHSGESLSKGKVNYLGEIICPWHNYRFQLSTGMACDSSCHDLVTYPIRSDQSGFFIGI
jgi:3-phenylpropionate/trans-cinnamate dioxygenase ferredoxin subunit